MDNVLRRSLIPNVEKYLFDCPGCGQTHFFYREPPLEWNGSWSHPTLNRILVFGDSDHRCIFSMVEGQMYFGRECHHKLADKQAKMIPWE